MLVLTGAVHQHEWHRHQQDGGGAEQGDETSE
jgi:hypothetical protein